MLRMTQQREVILEELNKYHGHPTADELFVKVRKRLSRISLATVYRNLNRIQADRHVSLLDWLAEDKRVES